MNTLTCNTKQERPILPEYGKNIQNMVDYCVSVSDREKRNQCAGIIIRIMGNRFPYLRETDHFKHILWSHLAIMSGFLLDIDYPYKEIKRENISIKPQKLPYSQSFISCKHYGKNIEKMIGKIAEYEEGKKKERLIQQLAIYMKKSLIIWNSENGEIEDSKIFEDITQLSNKKILFDENHYKPVIQLKYTLPKKQKKWQSSPYSSS